jgi:hypothetical protein
MNRRQFVAGAAVALGQCAAGCQGGGNFSLFGYSTAPPYDPDIRTVYIPVFKNPVFHTTPVRGIEVQLTEAIVAELNSRRTPMRVVSDPAKADTELIGTITNVAKQSLNPNLFFLAREYNVVISCEVVWRDNRKTRNLSGSVRPPVFAPDPPFDPSREPPPPPGPELVPAVSVVSATGRVLPELGESTTTGAQKATQVLARQIVNMMERPW